VSPCNSRTLIYPCAGNSMSDIRRYAKKIDAARLVLVTHKGRKSYTQLSLSSVSGWSRARYRPEKGIGRAFGSGWGLLARLKPCPSEGGSRFARMALCRRRDPSAGLGLALSRRAGLGGRAGLGVFVLLIGSAARSLWVWLLAQLKLCPSESVRALREGPCLRSERWGTRCALLLPSPRSLELPKSTGRAFAR